MGRVDDGVGHLRRFFETTPASKIGGDDLARYVRSRQEEGRLLQRLIGSWAP